MAGNGKVTVELEIKSREYAMFQALRSIARNINRHNRGSAAWRQSLIARTTLLSLYNLKEDELNGDESE